MQRYPMSRLFKGLMGKKHLGLDLIVPVGTKIRAYRKGEVIKSFWGPDGGYQIWFKPNKEDVIIRYMHLKEKAKLGKFKEKETIAISGNTGISTTPHIHTDISKHTVNLNDLGNFLDPDKFDY